MFFIHHGEEIAVLINAILDNLAAIVAGNISAAADKVEGVMAKAIPLVIGFLASLLGVGGIGEKVKSVINAVQKPINKAVDWVLKTVVKPVAKMAARAIGFVKGKVKSGVDWMKKKAKAGVEKLKSKLRGKKPDQAKEPGDETVSVAFAMHGASHHLTLQMGPAPVVDMASASGSDIRALLSQALDSARAQRVAIDDAKTELKSLQTSKKQRGRQEALRCFIQCAEKPSKGGAGASQVEELDAIAALESQITAAARSARTRQKVRQLLQQLAKKLESYANRWNLSNLGPMAERTPKDVGSQLPYRESGRGREETFGTLEAEHIMPGKILNILIRGLSGRRLYTDDAYRGASTLLIPEMMADIKTHQGAGASASDRRLIDAVKATAARINRRLREGHKVNRREIMQINQLLESRVLATKQARDEAIGLVLSGAERAPGRMARSTFADEMRARLPDSAIESTALHQMQELWDLAKRAESVATDSEEEPAEECTCSG
jgi:hypothetical protein